MNALAEKARLAQEALEEVTAADFAATVAAETRLGLDEKLGLTGSLRSGRCTTSNPGSGKSTSRG